MSDLRKAAQEALDALKWAEEYHGGDDCYAEAISALRAALQDEGKPVAWVNLEAWKSGEYCADDCFSNAPRAENVPIYTAPPQRPLLTDDEVDELSRTMVKGNKSVNWLCRAIERKVRGEE